MITNLEAAGHRVDGPHDCLLTNCRGLGYELKMAHEQIVRLAGRVQALEDQLEERGWEPEPAAMSYPPAVIKGEVGTIQGPPIAGTSDTTNAGPARGKAATQLQAEYELEDG